MPDSAAAMEVVERMRGLALNYQWALNTDSQGWSAEVWVGDSIEVACGRDVLLSRAICKAALAAVGEKLIAPHG